MGHRIAVVIRTKNRPEFLTRALADIAAQSYADVEVVVVNDGGDRAAVERVVASSTVIERTTIVDTELPGGRSAAANVGIHTTDAEYVALHDDDDLWHPDFLAETVAWLDEHPEYGGVSVATEIVFEDLHRGVWRETGRALFWESMTQISLGDMLVVNRIVPISLLYRRALHDEHGDYDETLDAVEDWEFYLRVLQKHPIGFLAGEPRAYWSHRPAADGAAANSMFDLAAEHSRDDAVVRDRALRGWIENNGNALPLYIASVERRLRDEFAREFTANLERQREEIVAAVYERHPLWRRLRRLRQQLRRSRDTDRA